MKHSWLVLLTVLVLSIGLAAQSAPGAAQMFDWDGIKIYDSDSVVKGRTFGEWDEAWQQWAYSIPVAQHPLFDNGHCSVGQTGPVWFLGGKFCFNGGVCSYTAVRSCSIPAGKLIYFPVVNGEDSVLEENINEHPGDLNYQQINYMRSLVTPTQDPTDVFCQIDGKPVRDLGKKFTVQSTVFGFTIPDDNYLKAVYPPPNNFEAGTYFGAVDSGTYLMLSLPPGNHTLHFGASWLDITYNLTVK